MALKPQTQKTLRNLYYIGIVLLAVNALSQVRESLAFLLDMQIGTFMVVEVLAILVLIGAVFAWNRRVL